MTPRKLKVICGKVDKQPKFSSTPSCCGSEMVLFSERYNNNVVKSYCTPFQSSGMIVLVFAKHLPNTAIKLCDGVGMLKRKKVKKDRYALPEKPKTSGFRMVNTDGVLVDGGRRSMDYNRPTYRQKLMRMYDGVFFLHYLYDIDQSIIDKVIKPLTKGDIVFAISSSDQLSEKRLLMKNGFKVMHRRFNSTYEPGDQNMLYLHMFKKS